MKENNMKEKIMKEKIMKNVYELRKPLMVNGEEVRKLEYDFDAITVDDYSTADELASAGRTPGNNIRVAEFDSKMGLYLFFVAITAVNKKIDISDLKRIKGYDLIQMASIGRNFMLSGSVEDSADDIFESVSGNTAEPTTKAPTTSDNAD